MAPEASVYKALGDGLSAVVSCLLTSDYGQLETPPSGAALPGCSFYHSIQRRNVCSQFKSLLLDFVGLLVFLST